MPDNLIIHLAPGFDERLVPIPAKRLRDWWEDNQRTANHAKHCLPLSMANSLGWYILSPGTFIVRWNGDVHAPATIQHIEKSSHYEVDTHATFGGFTVQPRFVPVTQRPGDFVFIKGVPNERGLPYTCMEAIIEAWWNVGLFGLVFLLNQPGEFMIPMGQPIAHMFLYRGAAGAATMELRTGLPEGHAQWMERRGRLGYTKDLDYMRGFKADGSPVESHIINWKDAARYD